MAKLNILVSKMKAIYADNENMNGGFQQHRGNDRLYFVHKVDNFLRHNWSINIWSVLFENL